MPEQVDQTREHVAASEAADDPRVLELVKEYQAELESGCRPERARILAKHPELADAVAPYLDGLDLLHRGAKDLTRPGPPPTTRLETGLSRGDRLGEFTIIKEVGRGGMGIVYEAMQPSLNRRVALKVLPAALASDHNRLRRFALEAQAAAAVSHENIVPVYAVGEDRGVNFYAMRLIEGSPLDSLAAGIGLIAKQSHANSTQPLDLHASGEALPPPGRLIDLARWDRVAYRRAVARLGAQVARALDHAHQAGIIHRDVKPANLLLGRDGHIWVTDFGLAQFVEAGSVTRTGTAIGTLRYMSPEQASGDRRRLDHRTDVYSLAVTLFELLSGRPAFLGEEPLSLMRQIVDEDPPALRSCDPTCPADLETVLLKAMQKDPRDRYATAADFADDLERFLAGLPVQARRPWAWDRAKRWAGRHPATVGAVMVSLAVIGVAFGITTALVAAEQTETAKANQALAREQEETRKAHLLAEDRARSERARADEAERRFRQSKEMTDLVLQISEEELNSSASFQGPRRRLLRAALANYQNLVADSQDDPAMRAELDRITARVDGLLTELAEKREAEPAFLLERHEIKAELGLSPEQIEQIDRIFAKKMVGPPKGGPSAPGVPPDFRGPPLDPAARTELIRILTVPQRQRLRQIYWQESGPMAFNDPDVIEALDLTPPQRQQIRLIQNEVFMRPFGRTGGFGGPGPNIQPKGGPGGNPGPAPKGGGPGGPQRQPDVRDFIETRARVMERILDLLTPEQRAEWQQLIGKPFNPTIPRVGWQRLLDLAMFGRP